MTDNCWNKAKLTGNFRTLKRIESKFNSMSGVELNFSNYSKLFTTDVSDVEGDDWGPKWFKFEHHFEDRVLVIEGESFQIPIVPFFEILSDEYGVNCDMVYDQNKFDFAGIINWKKGTMMRFDQYRSWEFRFIYDEDNFYKQMEKTSESNESYDDWLNQLKIEDWKEKPVLDFNRLNQIWDKKIIKVNEN